MQADLLIHAKAVRTYQRAHGEALLSLGYRPACSRCTTARCCTNDTPLVSRTEAEILAQLVRVRADLTDVPAKVVDQVRALTGIVPGQGLRDRRGEFPCPFLSADLRCRVYAHRPIGCVQCFGENAAACAASTDGKKGWDHAPAEGAGIIRQALRIGGKPAERALAFAPPGSEDPPPLVIGLAMVLSPETLELVNAAVAAAGKAESHG